MKNNYEKMTRGEAAEFLGVTKNTIRLHFVESY